MPKLITFFIVIFLSAARLFAAKPAPDKDFYQIRVYHLKNAEQEKTVDDFLKLAYLPALHRAGIAKIGVFKPVQTDNNQVEKLIYVFIPFRSYQQFSNLENVLKKDKKLKEEGKTYLDALHTAAPYERMESILLNAFEGHRNFKMPNLISAKAERIYELRSYESPTEKLAGNKIEMFNKGDEIGLFNRLNFNAVFYAEVIAGSRMPNLMYLTTFENKADRDEHWKTFGKDEQWQKLKSMPEYQNNVSRNDTRFLYPVDYSDI